MAVVMRLPVFRFSSRKTLSECLRARLLSRSSAPQHSPDAGSEIRTDPTKEELENEEPWMQREIVKYYRGKNLLAKLMGQDPKTFSEKDIEEAVHYLLPSSLTAKDARPFLKHPTEIFPKRKEAAFDLAGRPLEPAFYTGFPAYHNLIYEIYECSKILQESDAGPHTGSGTISSKPPIPQTNSIPTEADKSDSGSDLGSRSTEFILKSQSDSLQADPNLVSKKTSSSIDEEDMVLYAEDMFREDGAPPPPQTNSNGTVSLPSSSQWVKKDTMSNLIAEELSDERYEDLISRLTELASHPSSSLISEFLNKYRRPMFVYRSQTNPPKINKDGYAYAVGRRKMSVAQVWLREGYGKITVNKRSFVEFFPRVEDRQQVLYPFLVIDQLGKWDVETIIRGGGTTGQAGALRLGISKALLAFKGDHGDKLERAGLLIRDPRMVERKKPGQKKARKKFAWVKR